MPIADMPQSNKQHAVPQQVMSVDFKLIGDLTMRQFAYVFVAGILAYLSYVFFIGIFRWPLVFLIAFGGLGFAFIPVQERGMDEWVVNFFKAMNMPTQRIWKKDPVIPSALMYDNLVTIKQELITLAPTSSRRKLEEYLKYQTGEDEDSDPLDISQKENLRRVRSIFPDYKKRNIFSRAFSHAAPSVTADETQPTVAVTDEEPVVAESFVPPVATETEPQKSPSTPGILVEEPTPYQETAQQVSEPVAAPKPMEEEKRKDKGILQVFKGRAARGRPPTEEKVKTAPSVPSRAAKAGLEPLSGTVMLKPITPDMHSGRRFTNLLPSQGELILPIRGERVLRTTEEISVEESMNEKAKKLQDLLKKIRDQEGIKIPKAKAPPVEVVQKVEQEAQQVHDEAVDVVGKLKSQSDELTDEIKRLKRNILSTHAPGTASETQERLLQDLESKQQKVEQNYQVLSRGIQNLKSDVPTPVVSASELGSDDSRMANKKPNTIQGVVKDKDGKIMSDVLLLIKNDRDEPGRALKTDSLGRFELLSSLSNGKYSIEVKPSEEFKLSFEKISVELKGEVVPSLVISGK